MAQFIQTAINATTGASVQVLPADPLRRYMAVQIYTNSTGNGFMAFGKLATIGTAGEWQLNIGSVVIWGTVPPPVISTDQTYITPAPPLSSVNIIGGSGNIIGSILTISG